MDAHGKVKISGPMNGAPLPAGYKLKDAPPPEQPPPMPTSDRREKTRSRAFWGFGRTHGKGFPYVVRLAGS